jgi:hypothetical protein
MIPKFCFDPYPFKDEAKETDILQHLLTNHIEMLGPSSYDLEASD